MTPKQKAEELYEKFMDHAEPTTYHTVQCAIIAVEEIISISKQEYYRDYWNKVLTELKAMQ